METEWKPTTLHPLHDEFEATVSPSRRPALPDSVA
jgi:hypothetical protein